MADLGLVSGGYDGKVYRWPRAGAGFGPREALATLEDPHVACHAADWDRDGKTDLIVGGRHGEIRLLRNLGGRFAAPVEIAKAPAGDAGPHAADWDGDGDLDLLVGDAKGTVTLWRRAAGKLDAGETLVDRSGRVCTGGGLCGIRAKPWVADWNGDGKQDLLVGDFHDHRGPGREGNEHMHGWIWFHARK